MPADLRQLICKGDIDCTEGILDNLSHLSGTNICNNDFALTERRIESLHLFPDGLVICANGAVVVQQLIDHVTGNDTLWSVDKIDVFTNFEAICLNHRTDILVDYSEKPLDSITTVASLGHTRITSLTAPTI